MKIRLALLGDDVNYLRRFMSSLELCYKEKFEIYSFTDMEIAMATLHSKKINVFIADESFDIDRKNIPSKCAFAYAVSSPDIGKLKGEKTICKFQKIDLVYKKILNMFSEMTTEVKKSFKTNEKCHTTVFTSICGGAGCSSMAMAYAMCLSRMGKKCLYLNMEKFGSPDTILKGEGLFGLSDVIFSIKGHSSNIGFKIESCVKQDVSGVYFLSQTKSALDMYELKVEEISELMNCAINYGEYDCIIVDMAFSMEKEHLKFLTEFEKIVWVSDGTDNSNVKISRAFKALEVKEKSLNMEISSRIVLMYNRFSSKRDKVLSDIELKMIGGAPRFEQANSRQIVEKLSTLPLMYEID